MAKRTEKHLAGSATGLSIGQYLIRRLQDYGITDVFGIPGDYVLSFYSMLEQSPINVIGCTREDCAGYAADAYARVNGMGAVYVTYCVGGFSVANSIAGAYAEKSPVVMLTGSPGLSERINDPLLHHKVRDSVHSSKYSSGFVSLVRSYRIRPLPFERLTEYWKPALVSNDQCISIFHGILWRSRPICYINTSLPS